MIVIIRNMKFEHFLIAAGILILLASAYQYTRSPSPPEGTLLQITTTKPTTAKETTSLAYSAPTTKRPTTAYQFTFSPVTTSTTARTTTTLMPESCLNGRLDAGETYADCAVQCGSCVLLELGGGWQRYLSENMWLRFRGIEVLPIAGGPCPDKDIDIDPEPDRPVEYLYHCQHELFHIDIKSYEADFDKRTLMAGDVAHVEGFVIALTDANANDTMPVYVKKDINAMRLQPEYSIITVGGHDCNRNQTGFCSRNYMGYTIRLRQRETNKAIIDITTPSGKKIERIELYEGGETKVIEGLRVGLLYYYEKGGYSTLYVKKL